MMTGIQGLIVSVTNTINLLIPVCLGIALLGFIFGIIKYIASASNSAKIAEAKQFIFFSILGLAVMLSIWALATVVVTFFIPYPIRSGSTIYLYSSPGSNPANPQYYHGGINTTGGGATTGTGGYTIGIGIGGSFGFH